MKSIKKKTGFTVIEILFVILLTSILLILIVNQKNNIEATNRDRERKSSINAMYFQLVNVYYKQNNHYPESISPEILPGVDPAIFTDPNGVYMEDVGSNYSYTTSNCDNGKCQNFKLTATLEKEAAYIKGN